MKTSKLTREMSAEMERHHKQLAAIRQAAAKQFDKGERRTVLINYSTASEWADSATHQFMQAVPDFQWGEWSTHPLSVTALVASPKQDSMRLYGLAASGKREERDELRVGLFPFTDFTPQRHEHDLVNSEVRGLHDMDHVAGVTEALGLRVGRIIDSGCHHCAPPGSFAMFNYALSEGPEAFVTTGGNQKAAGHQQRDDFMQQAWSKLLEDTTGWEHLAPEKLTDNITGKVDVDLHVLEKLAMEQDDELGYGEETVPIMWSVLTTMSDAMKIRSAMRSHRPKLDRGTLLRLRDRAREADAADRNSGPAGELRVQQQAAALLGLVAGHSKVDEYPELWAEYVINGALGYGGWHATVGEVGYVGLLD